MRQVRFARKAVEDLVRELTYSERNWGTAQQRKLRLKFESVWQEIASRPERGRSLGPGRYLLPIHEMKLVVLYRWDGGEDEDPRVAAVLSARRDLGPDRIDDYFAGRE